MGSAIVADKDMSKAIGKSVGFGRETRDPDLVMAGDDRASGNVRSP